MTRRWRERFWSGVVAVWGAGMLGCGGGSEAQWPADVIRSEVLTFRHPAGGEGVSGLRVSGSGSLDGRARVVLLRDGEPYRSEEVGGTFRFEWRTEWDAPEAVVSYEPEEVTQGNVVISCRFE